jgi:hypothetical protein
VTQKSGNLQEVFATGPESAFNFARGFMGFRKLMEDGSAANTHALVELVSSCRSEYDNFGVLEVNREGDPVFADSSPEKTLDAPNGFHIATEGIHRHLS